MSLNEMAGINESKHIRSFQEIVKPTSLLDMLFSVKHKYQYKFGSSTCEREILQMQGRNLINARQICLEFNCRHFADLT